MATDSSLLKVSNIVALVLTVIINSIAGATTILGGVNTAEISDAYPTLVTPAGYAFGIWGVIYLLLGGFVVYQALPSQKGKDFQKKIGWLFVISSILNIAWIFCWQYQQLIVSVVLISIATSLLPFHTPMGGVGHDLGKPQRVMMLENSIPTAFVTESSTADGVDGILPQ